MIRILLLLVFTGSLSFAQSYTSTIRGTVKDADTGIPLVNASIQLSPAGLGIGSNAEGIFRFDRIPVGRYVLTVSYLGYETITIPEILLESGKESIQEIRLNPAGRQLDEATVVSSAGHVAFNSIQAITIEQTLRYAATYLDPARVATSFAGVATTNDQANGLVIRGNSPNSMQWRLEGVEIVNPNHLSNAGTFSDRATQTGGGVNILSTQLLGTTYFLTGAFPAQYGNALSGVLDMNLRKGNDEKTEFVAQVGLIGLDIAAEGPFSKKSKASYLANYRYSFTGLLGAIGVDFGGESINFQDFSFNINLPTAKAGTFTFFGLGGNSSNTFSPDKDTTAWEFQKDGYNIIYKNKMGAAGATHAISLGKRSALNSTVVASGLSTSRYAYTVNKENFEDRKLFESDKMAKSKISASSIITHKYSSEFRLKGGVYGTWQFDEITRPGDLGLISNSIKGFIFQPFASLTYYISPVLTAEVGVHYLHYTTTRSNSYEPRGALRWQVSKSGQFSFSYGRHSQLQLPQVYLSGSDAFAFNRKIHPTKSTQFVVGYQKKFRKSSSLKVEVYSQELYQVPVSASSQSSFSAINLVETYIDQNLVNNGTGNNYGVEGTYQKLLTDQFYILLSGSLYSSKYVGSDGIRRDSRFNGGHTFSFTGGKEFKNRKESTWGINTKILWIGGFRDTPIDFEASSQSNSTVYLNDQAFTLKMRDYFRPDLRIYWKKSKAKFSRTLALDIQNISGTKNDAYSYYDTYQKKVVRQNQLGMIPVVSYRWEF
ncbi:TonB-dependent receptor [Dyadobacter psychrotolerans]|uniref:TonB-dependent receptor n=1 Tax=Dyadobacter psychrotolerans TaxID=2541721 RepID=A0A4R5E1W8_9BACT|nr:TonB-dependent receptor [Dyadobacter psychrotolerans]TDE18135.1 TonB-dependent receptor [Dyadobacter psychrotolerans]